MINTLCYSEMQAGAKLSLTRQFTDERWSKHRVVTCLDWSPQVTKEYILRAIGAEFTGGKQNTAKSVQFDPLHVKIYLILLSYLMLTKK